MKKLLTRLVSLLSFANMHRVKWLHVSLVFLLTLGLAMPAMAQVLYNSEEPGSVIVFPKFINGTFRGEPNSFFEISVVCPVRNADGSCALIEGSVVKLRAHWVCPGEQSVQDKFICRETDFDLFTTVFGTLVFSPSNVNIGPTPAFPTAPLARTPGGIVRVPAPPCREGYLIAWVVDTNDRPINFNALIGNAVIRDVNGAQSAYNGIPIQAVGATVNPPALIATGGALLPFLGVAGTYAAVTGVIQSSVRFDAGLVPGPAVSTELTLLTLDVRSNQPNFPTFVPLDFYNANEAPLSTFLEFVCWTEVALSNVNGAVDFIDPNLTGVNMQTLKGLVTSGPANKIPFIGIADTPGPVTLLGIVRTSLLDGTAASSYSYSLYNDSRPVPTLFAPTR